MWSCDLVAIYGPQVSLTRWPLHPVFPTLRPSELTFGLRGGISIRHCQVSNRGVLQDVRICTTQAWAYGCYTLIPCVCVCVQISAMLRVSDRPVHNFPCGRQPQVPQNFSTSLQYRPSRPGWLQDEKSFRQRRPRTCIFPGSGSEESFLLKDSRSSKIKLVGKPEILLHFMQASSKNQQYSQYVSASNHNITMAAGFRAWVTI